MASHGQSTPNEVHQNSLRYQVLPSQVGNAETCSLVFQTRQQCDDWRRTLVGNWARQRNGTNPNAKRDLQRERARGELISRAPANISLT
jgi:hypothetical protein